MINTDKTTTNKPLLDIAGLHPADNGIEFQGIRGNKKVLWMQHGNNHHFTDLPEAKFNLLKEQFLSDRAAYDFISKIHSDIKQQVELYTYYMYGDLDGTPDIKDGVLAPAENFRDTQDCPSLLWHNKNITIDGYVLNPAQILIIDNMLKGYPDKYIVAELGISHSYFDGIKGKLLKSTNCSCSKELIIKAINQKVMLND